MSNPVRDDSNISGKYRHFKGKFYILFCVVYDSAGKKYVLYQQCYGDKSFWIRPYEMFFENVQDGNGDGDVVPRFSPTSGRREKASNKIKALIEMLEKQSLFIRHTETEEEYVITRIDESNSYIEVYPVENNYGSGYLTDFELLRRLGYTSYNLNGQVIHKKSRIAPSDEQKLQIGENDIDEISKHINPCSIDLQIADSGYICTRRNEVDPQSVETISTAEHLWKFVRTYPSKQGNHNYIKLRPGKTILTHTKEKIRVPNDCAAKIEIKSTFARLSIDVTSGDFCNPGYYGYYPLEITNRGSHTIILHSGETMTQLMLIPLRGPILENYNVKATYKDKEGLDDGTPFSFWRERAIKTLRKEKGTQKIVDLYDATLATINADNTTDVNDTKKRFADNFLCYCQKRIKNSEYQGNDGLPDEKKLIKAYCKSEKNKQKILSFKWVAIIVSILTFALPFMKYYLRHLEQPVLNWATNIILSIPFWIYILTFLFAIAGTFFLYLRMPRVFCTFEKIDIEKLCENAARQK